MLVASWAHLGPRWPHVEPSWADLGPILGPCWAHVGPMFGGYVGPMLGICWGCSKWRSRGATGQWVRLVGTWVQFTGYMGAISWYSGATSGYIPTYWQSPMHTFADRFPYLSQLCRKNHCLKPNSRKFNGTFWTSLFLGDRNNQRQTNKDIFKMHPAGQILVGSGLGHVQTVFLHDSTLVVLFTAHLFIYLYFHFHFKLNNRMCFGPPCFPLYLFIFVWFQRVICRKKHRIH